MKRKIRTFLNILIISLFVIGLITTVFLYYKGYDFSAIFLILDINIYYKIILLLLIYLFRNYLFIPSTFVIILSGLFLNNYLITIIVSLIGVSIGLMHCYLIGYLFAQDLEKKKIFNTIKKYNKEINENGFKVIFLGSMFPALPTDAICYAAGIVRYQWLKFLIAGILGELPLILLYSYLGVQAEKYMKYFVYFIGFFFLVLLIYYYRKYKKT